MGSKLNLALARLANLADEGRAVIREMSERARAGLVLNSPIPRIVPDTTKFYTPDR